jgi:hypothetical protein
MLIEVLAVMLTELPVIVAPVSTTTLSAYRRSSHRVGREAGLVQSTDGGGTGCSQVMEAFSATVRVWLTVNTAVWQTFQSGCLAGRTPAAALPASAREEATVTQGSLMSPSMVQLPL